MVESFLYHLLLLNRHSAGNAEISFMKSQSQHHKEEYRKRMKEEDKVNWHIQGIHDVRGKIGTDHLYFWNRSWAYEWYLWLIFFTIISCSHFKIFWQEYYTYIYKSRQIIILIIVITPRSQKFSQEIEHYQHSRNPLMTFPITPPHPTQR